MDKGGLASFVKERRERAGLSQEELAERAGFTQANVSNVERGRTRRLPDPEHRRRLARALGAGHVDLLLASGELDRDDLTTWLRRNRAEASSTERSPTWAARIITDLNDEIEGSARARLVALVLRLTEREADWLLESIEGMPTVGQEKRAQMKPEAYLAWRAADDAAYDDERMEQRL